MIDKNKNYTLEELLNLYSLYNLDFKFYGNNKNGNLELYMKTDTNIISVFSSTNFKMTKYDYLKLKEDEVMKLKFKFDREVKDLELDIVAIVIRTSDVNIPAGKYSLKTLDNLTKEQDQEERENTDVFQDGICYIIVDNNTACTLYDGVYIFNKENKGLIEDLKTKLNEEEVDLYKNNLNIILNYYNQISENQLTK